MANESTIQIRNSKLLLTEVYKFLNALSPPIMNEVFQTNDFPSDLRNPRILASKHEETIKYGINTINSKGPQIWQNIPLEIRNSESLSFFQIEYKTADTELTLSLQNLPLIHG